MKNADKIFSGLDFESTLSLTMQKKFYSLFGGVIKLQERYEYIKILRRSLLVIEKEYWDTNTRKIYSFDMTIIDLISLMNESIKNEENQLFAVIQLKNNTQLKQRFLFNGIKEENKKAYTKEKIKKIKEKITCILKKVICL